MYVRIRQFMPDASGIIKVTINNQDKSFSVELKSDENASEVKELLAVLGTNIQGYFELNPMTGEIKNEISLKQWNQKIAEAN